MPNHRTEQRKDHRTTARTISLQRDHRNAASPWHLRVLNIYLILQGEHLEKKLQKNNNNQTKQQKN